MRISVFHGTKGISNGLQDWLASISPLAKDKRTISLSDQLYRAVGSVSANIAEGYSRRSGKDQARFYEYALGSAREARGWYHQGRHVLSEIVAMHRIKLLTRITRLPLTIIPAERGYKLKEAIILRCGPDRPARQPTHAINTHHA
ncbi:MAG: four helix bundle protein [Anaerolineae bacterium]|nr:four helix bundle protein [Anaerolineae bacterium]MDH7474861.1 four helix bundle protein [Anaerolineae bacterium]